MLSSRERVNWGDHEMGILGFGNLYIQKVNENRIFGLKVWGGKDCERINGFRVKG